MNARNIDYWLDVYFAFFPDSHLNFPGVMYETLSEEEKAIFRTSGSIKRKNEFLYSRYYLRKYLAGYIDIPPGEIVFCKNRFGKPRIVFADHAGDRSAFNFNLSHSGNGFAFAISNAGEVGIDIQKIKINLSLASEVFLTMTEKDYISRFPPEKTQTELYKIWTRKEAVVKAFGRGLTFPLDHIETLGKCRYPVFSMIPRSGYYLSAALLTRNRTCIMRFYQIIINEKRNYYGDEYKSEREDRANYRGSRTIRAGACQNHGSLRSINNCSLSQE